MFTKDLIMIASPILSETKVENPEQQENKSRLEDQQKEAVSGSEVQDQSQQ